MIKRRLLLVFSVLFVFNQASIFGQATGQSSVAIALSEYCVSNIGSNNPQTDPNFANRADWVELYSNFTSSVNLTGWYLSNDRNNLFKWTFPTGFIMAPGQYRIVWLDGKNTVIGNNCHTNFTIDQCKKQWLILTSPSGVVRDSIAIQRTQEGHSRGRVDYGILGKDGWRIFTNNTFGLANTGPYYRAYAPQPIIKRAADTVSNYNGTSTGGFYINQTGMNLKIYLENNVPWDTSFTCFRIYYTKDNGQYPVPGGPGTVMYPDTTGIVTTNPVTLIRAIAVPVSNPNPNNPTGCQLDYLPSFCETNTYFTDPDYGNFTPEFGIISLSMDTTWLSGNGSTRQQIHVEYYDNQQQVSEGYTEINRPVNEAWLTAQKGFYMTIDDRRGFGCNFEGKIFNVDGLGASTRTVFPTLHLKAGDYESHSAPNNAPAGSPTQGSAILDVFYQSVAAKNNLHVNPLHIKPVIAFMDGQYWGVYDLRESYDKYYEAYYNHQSPDSVDMEYFHANQDGWVSYSDGPSSYFSTGVNSFAGGVYTLGVSPTINSLVNYNKLFTRLDQESFMDYMILNSYAMNGNIWTNNIAFARGQNPGAGSKWHYYMWNMPSIFNFTAVSLPQTTLYYNNMVNPCAVQSNPPLGISPYAGNSHGAILNNLMTGTSSTGSGRYLFQLAYKNRYQDLLNGPLKCENLLKQYDYVANLFVKELTTHETMSGTPALTGHFGTQGFQDTAIIRMDRINIERRCKVMAEGLGSVFPGCYGMRGPYDITVDVYPQGAGKVQLNSIVLDNYIWTGSYYQTIMSFKAIPTDDTYAFHHWEFQTLIPLNNAPISQDSLAVNFNQADHVVAVFTDKKNDIEMPTGFTPNGDGINDLFQPVGSALFSTEFDMSVWNRWGQQVFRTTDPKSGWDGNYKGEQAQTGVYAYVITYKNIFNESKVLKGNITLLR